MLAIDWSDAPVWARYAAQDQDGTICVFEDKPALEEDGCWYDTMRVKILVTGGSFRKSLTERPA